MEDQFKLVEELMNVSKQNGMMGKLQEVCPWLFWAWCFAHRLELARKDALSSQLFKDINDILFRLYYLYSKSPKKSRELVDIVEDLKEVFEFPKGGNLDIRVADGSTTSVKHCKCLSTGMVCTLVTF